VFFSPDRVLASVPGARVVEAIPRTGFAAAGRDGLLCSTFGTLPTAHERAFIFCCRFLRIMVFFYYQYRFLGAGFHQAFREED
jgi:hypothetical protein